MHQISQCSVLPHPKLPPAKTHHESHLRCLFVLAPLTLHTFILTRPPAAGQLTYTDPNTGVATVYNGGDIAWTLASTALVWLMVPGVGFFYSGLLRRKNALSLIYLSVAVLGVVSFEVRIFLDPPPYSCPLTDVRFSGGSGVTRSPSAMVPMHTSVTSSTLPSEVSMASRP